MRRFKIALVERGKEGLWRKYWVTSGSEGTAQEAPAGLGRTEIVEAATVEDAVRAITLQHPECTVMLAGGEHHIA
jgi:hypothetical protein